MMNKDASIHFWSNFCKKIVRIGQENPKILENYVYGNYNQLNLFNK